MRCFVALELDESIKDHLVAVQGSLKQLGGKVGWGTREQMHLTLKFLGEVAEDVVPRAVEAIRSAAKGIVPFDFVVEGLGAFPPSGSPRVLWAGIRPCEPLGRLHARIEEKFKPLGFEPENRDFTPHLTLGRVKEQVDAKAYRKMIAEHRADPFGTQRTEKVVLFSSTLRPAGAVYAPIAEVTLG
jgi:RNA 2',3'-cyclic 3'-phosphodiesterase